MSLLDQDDHGDGDDDDPDLEKEPTWMLTKSDWANAGYAASLAFEEVLMFCLQPQNLAISCQMLIDAHDCDYNLTNTVEALSQPWSKSSPKGPAVPVRLR